MDQRTRAVGAKHASAEAWVRVLLSQDHACVGIARGEEDLVSYSNKKNYCVRLLFPFLACVKKGMVGERRTKDDGVRRNTEHCVL